MYMYSTMKPKVSVMCLYLTRKYVTTNIDLWSSRCNLTLEQPREVCEFGMIKGILGAYNSRNIVIMLDYSLQRLLQTLCHTETPVLNPGYAPESCLLAT